MKIGGIFSATMLMDDEIGTLGYNYGSIQLTISQKKFWEALQHELGYRVVSVEYMGMWPGFEHQKSRYAIQLRKVEPTPDTTPVDLTPAKEVSIPSAFKQVRPYIIFFSVSAAVLLCVALAVWFLCVKGSGEKHIISDPDNVQIVSVSM